MGPREAKPIALIGLMGAGKSAVAARIGERLGASVADLDTMIEAEQGCSIAELFEREGERAFRRRESELLERVLRAGVRVLACGGGIVLDPAHRARLRERCDVVWLEVSPAEAARRVAAQMAARPLLRGHDAESRLAALLEERRALYGAAAPWRVATDGKSADQVADAVLAAVRPE
ncbi:MAG: shikimate kinase [Candidatus Eisenbacteria bacterium]|nr:shikimate kinase [Candidatus Eisenbacteria bacterium]